MARTWLLAHLIAAVITEEMVAHLIGFPPNAPACRTAADLPLAHVGNRATDPALCHPATTT